MSLNAASIRSSGFRVWITEDELHVERPASRDRHVSAVKGLTLDLKVIHCSARDLNNILRSLHNFVFGVQRDPS